MNSINCFVIVRSATFHSENQIFLLPEINTFCNRRRVTGIDRKLQQRPQTRESENINIPVEVPAVDGNNEVAGSAGEYIRVIAESRSAKVSRCNHSHHCIAAYGRRPGYVGGLRPCVAGERSKK